MTVPPGSPRTTVVSSPGKVLVAGGYLVLEPQYRGLVIATSSRFYCVVRDYHDAPGTGNNGNAEDVEDGVEGRDNVANDTRDTDSAPIVVRAGQFPAESSTWRYRLSLEQPSSSATQEKQKEKEKMSRSATQGEEEKEEPSHPSIILAPLDASKRNKFVEITLSRTLALAWEMIAAGPAQAAGVGKGTTDTGVAGSIDADADVAAGRELLRRLRGEGRACHLVMLADNDFYSQREQLAAASLPLRLSSLAALPPFHSLPRPITSTNKTGLGSSAALVTSLVAGLLSHLSLIDLNPASTPMTTTTATATATPQPVPTPSRSLDLVHSLAQLAHCLAQGKVGSGFDVSSAVYGSHLYRRFSPSILTPLMDAPISPIVLPSRSGRGSGATESARVGEAGAAGIRGTGSLISALDPSSWDQETVPSRLPRGIRMMLADVDAGTDTPSFVSRVLTFRKENRAEGQRLWDSLERSNGSVAEAIAGLVRLEGSEGYDEALRRAAEKKIDEVDRSTPTGDLLFRLAEALSTTRAHLRALSAASGVPVEPPEQTRLLDQCSALPGVIGGGVPGAGGFDAIFLLVLDKPAVVTSVEDTWETYSEMSVCPLSARQSDGGLRAETVGGVRGLAEALGRA